MCHYAVIDVKYKSKSEGPSLVAFADEESLNKRLAQLKENDLVESISLYSHKWTQDKTVVWRMRDVQQQARGTPNE